MLGRATELEGHPDNVAAAIYGGFVVCGADAEGAPLRGPLRPAGGARGDRRDPARGGLDQARPRGDPGRDPARRRGRQRLRRGPARARPAQRRPRPRLRRPRATAIHQPRRRELYPRSMEIVDAAAELGALGATISGAGPTVLVWTTWQDAGNVAAALEQRCAGWAEVRRLPFTPARRRRPRALDGLGRPDRPDRAGAGRAAGLGDGDPPETAGVADADRHRRPAADPPGPPRLRDDGPDPDRGRPRGPGPADRDRRSRWSSAPLVNPFLFVPLAFDPDVEKRLWYRLLAVVSFVGVSGGLVAAAIVGPA